jgi:two-component system CheB/CheR fusion protein
VQVWNSGSAELWGVRPDEAQGQQLWGLDIGLPMDGVRSALRDVLAGREHRVDVELDATNRRGRAIHIRVSCVPVGANDGAASGAMIVIDPLEPERAAASDGDG